MPEVVRSVPGASGAAAGPATAPAAVAPASGRRIITASVMLAMFLTAMEISIVATATPSIVSKLGGFADLTWVFSAFLLAQAATIPIYGRLADLYGRRRVFAAGTGLFLVGSLLCGLAGSMTQLILFRVVQGMGAGAVQPVASTIIGDIFSLEERARLQGWLSSMWALASLVGPLLGGFIVEHLHWAWIFWVNLPIGPLAIAGVYLFLQEPKTRRRHSVDYAGAALLASGVSLLLFGLLQGGVAWAWGSWQSVGMLGGALLLLVGFVLRQRRAPEPILPLDLFKNRAVALADCGFLLIGGVVPPVTTFIPLFVQGVLGGTPTEAGFTLVPMSIGWPLASTFAGRAIMALGFRWTALLGAVLGVIGSVLLVWSAGGESVVWIGLALLVQGAGFGFMSTTLIVGLQSSVPWSSRGVATASAMFSRQLGSTVWVAMLGSVLNAVLISRISTAGRDGPGLTSVLLDRTARASLDPAALQGLESALAGGIQAVFVGVLATVVLLLVVAWLLPSAPTEPAAEAA